MVRDGIQRNIEVCEVESGKLSLYPAFSLVPATRNIFEVYYKRFMILMLFFSR